MEEAILTRPRTLSEWQKMFSVIYDDHNKGLYSDADLLLHVAEELSESLESLRKEKYPEISSNLPHIFAWLMGFCNRLEIDLSKVTWHKYPNICPYCLESANCACISKEFKYRPADSELTRFRKDTAYMPVSLGQWQTMFGKIYGKINNNVASIASVFLHLAEELGEISKEFRTKNRPALEAEIADFFAWLLSTSVKLRIDLDESVWRCYPGECDRCKKEKCQCPSV